MKTVYECPKCGAHHLATSWIGKAICSCPACQEPSHVEEIKFLDDLSKSRFWPFFLVENEIIEQNPEWGKW